MSTSQNLKTYDFNSVGELNTVYESTLTDPLDNVPVGIKTPMALATYGNSGPFVMRTELGDQIRDNFGNMLSTNHGDRLMLHDFGANLEELVFELGTSEGDVVAINRIRATTEKYMPFIQLETFEPLLEDNIEPTGLAFIGIRILYSVPSINLTNQGIEVILYTAG